MERTVITGLGMLSGLGVGANNFWGNLYGGIVPIEVVREWEIEDIGPQYFSKCPFDFFANFKDMSAPFPLRYSQLALMGCRLAIEDASLQVSSIDPTRLGLILNSDLGASAAAESYAMKLYGKGPDRVSPFEFTKSVSNCAVGDVARYFKIMGPSSFIVGENSISYGFDLLTFDRADVVICGAFDEVRERTIWTYHKHHLLSNVKENGHSMVVEKEDDVILGEGAGFIVLEKYEHAIRRNAKIYAEIIAEYSSCDSISNEVVFDRRSEDLADNMRAVIDTAEIGLDEIAFVMGAGCMPWQVASYDLAAISSVWNDKPVLYTNLKNRIGESFSSSTSLSIGAAALALSNGWVPALSYPPGSIDAAPNVELPADAVKIESGKNYALVNSIQIGGNTTSFLLKRI